MQPFSEITIDAGFRDDVLSGLSAPRKSLPSKYFYDAEGSRLFEAICDLPEYYLTRTETALLASILPEIAGKIAEGAALVEFGSGASKKTRLLLDAAPQLALYLPIDISESALAAAARSIEADYPDLRVAPLVGDFTQPLRLPDALRGRQTVGFFPGSTIGNFAPDAAEQLLLSARSMLGADALFLLGADLVKDRDVLVRAYDDAQGVTAAFNRNLLVRINRELGASFAPAAFAHRALWNESDSRIEMHLVSEHAQQVQIGAQVISFAAGETIHTENSYKFTPARLSRIAERAGWRVDSMWASEALPFGVFLLSARSPAGAIDHPYSFVERSVQK